MAIIAPHARALERKNIQAHNVVRNILPRETPTTQNGQPVVNPLPVSVRVLTAFFVVLGVLIVGIITWRIVVWKRRKTTTASEKYLQGSFAPSEKIRPIVEVTPMEKQEVLVILPMQPPMSVPASSARWKPQLPKDKDGSTIVDVKAPAGPEAAMSPPPTYIASSSPASSRSNSPRPPALNLPAVTVTHDDSMLSVPVPPSAVPSPRRTSSFFKEAPTDGNSTNLKPRPSIKGGLKVPRKMLVEHTFIPSLADELSIKVGEVLTMLEEYEDEWCLVERIGSRTTAGNSERGVVPRFCLKERPRRGGHKRAQSSASASSSVRSGAAGSESTKAAQ